VNVDFVTGTILPHPEYNDIVQATDRLLANIDVNENIVDTDEYIPELSDDTNDDVSESCDDEVDPVHDDD
jgi:hypothetical protein